MFKRVIVPAIICVVLTISSVASVWAHAAGTGRTASEDAASDKFARLADALYDAAKQSNRQAGYINIQQLQNMAVSLKTNHPGQSDGWNLIEQSAADIKKTLAGNSASTDWLTDAARIQLAGDALIHPEAPLWYSYEAVMRDDLDRVKKAWSRNDGAGALSARGAIDSFAVHLDRIEAAASLQQDPEKIADLKRRLAYTTTLLDAGIGNHASPEWIGRSIDELSVSLTGLFEGTAAAEPLPAIAPLHTGNPISWILLLGAFIMGVLAFAGYRKYKQQPYGIKPFR
ncbi:sporulation protein YpjB [Paenibacillus protaetiae]|nr:sporulation protein YpjB [Paenibacillus protaetiae]